VNWHRRAVAPFITRFGSGLADAGSRYCRIGVVRSSIVVAAITRTVVVLDESGSNSKVMCAPPIA
jgi:hypothetical protein